MRFKDSLDRKAEEIQRPPNLPIGHYVFAVQKHPEIDDFTNADGQTSDRVNFTCVLVQPTDDVDTDELAEFGKVEGTLLRKTIWIADGDQDPAGHEKGMFQLKQFFKTLGLDESMTIGESLAACVNTQFIGEVIRKQDKEDPEIQYDNLGRTAPVD